MWRTPPLIFSWCVARERLAGPRVWRGGHSDNRHLRGMRPCHGKCPAIGRSDYRCRMFFAPTPCGSVRQQPESRLNGDGTLDSSFGVNGRAIDPTARGFVIKAIAVQADDGIVAVRGFNSHAGDFVVARLHANGARTRALAFRAPKYSTGRTGYDLPFYVAIQSDGRILVTGEVGQGIPMSGTKKWPCCVCWVTGTLDQSFGAGGWWTYAPDGERALGVTCKSAQPVCASCLRPMYSSNTPALSPRLWIGSIGWKSRMAHSTQPTGSGALRLLQFVGADFPILARPAARGLSWLNDAYKSDGYYVALDPDCEVWHS